MRAEYEQWLPEVIRLAKAAGVGILEYYGLPLDRLHVREKSDHTLLTQADHYAHEILYHGLSALTPVIPILSEEGIIAPWGLRQHWAQYWLLDPLDGTRGFTEQCSEFTVNIALIDHHQPVLGVVYAPVSNTCYFAIFGQPAFKQVANEPPVTIQTNAMNWSAFQVILGRYLRSPHFPEIVAHTPGCGVIRLNSSLKFCWIAEGRADIYPRFGDTSEWDTAAAQCVLAAAGGAVVDFMGKNLQYNAKLSLVNPAFVAVGDPQQQAKIIQFIEQKRRESRG